MAAERAASEVADSSATDFARMYQGRVAALSSDELLVCLEELGELNDALVVLQLYPQLSSWTGADDARVRPLDVKIVDHLNDQTRFFVSEWAALSEEHVERLLASDQLADYRWSLRLLRGNSRHRLSSDAEAALASRKPAAETAWQDLARESLSKKKFFLGNGDDGREYALAEVAGMRFSSDRPARHDAVEAYFRAPEAELPLFAHCYDTLVADRLATDRLRGFAKPTDEANLANEISDGHLSELLDRVESAYPLAQRWLRTKGRLIGVEQVELADMYAPLATEGRIWSWEEALASVTEAFRAFPVDVQEQVQDVISRGHIDPFPRPGKASGAWCFACTGGVAPYVLMNFTGSMSDVSTLAHELGHAMHFGLSAREQPALNRYADYGVSPRENLIICETASNFAQLVWMTGELAQASGATTGRAILAALLDDTFAMLFIQVMLTRFEQSAYWERANGTQLSAPILCRIWNEHADALFGDIPRPSSYEHGWALVPHFMVSRFGTYPYVAARLIAFALLHNWKEDPERFMPTYREFLAAGASGSPEDLLAPLGVDLVTSACWDDGIDHLETLLDEIDTINPAV